MQNYNFLAKCCKWHDFDSFSLVVYWKFVLTQFIFGRHPPFLITCTPHDTVAKLLDLIAMNKIHRVYVCESEDSLKPIRVITLTDILKCVLDAAAMSKKI